FSRALLRKLSQSSSVSNCFANSNNFIVTAFKSHKYTKFGCIADNHFSDYYTYDRSYGFAVRPVVLPAAE
ncbi:MAG: hypothetical protein SOY07_04040, partial [Bacteroidales bacterium]|nr:hypothetical protein [Bacteroidales bacterium]